MYFLRIAVCICCDWPEYLLFGLKQLYAVFAIQDREFHPNKLFIVLVFTSSEVKFRKLNLEALPVSAAFTANHVSNHVGKGGDRFPIPNQFYRPLSHGGHIESQENKKLCFCTASLALNSRLGEAYRAKTKLFILLRINMVPSDKGL